MAGVLMSNGGTGSDAAETASPAGDVVGLADALAALGKEVAAAQESSKLSPFEVADIEAEFSVATTTDAQGRLRLWVVSAEDATAHPASHRVRFKLRRGVGFPFDTGEPPGISRSPRDPAPSSRPASPPSRPWGQSPPRPKLPPRPERPPASWDEGGRPRPGPGIGPI